MRVWNRVCRSRFSLLIFIPGANPLTLESSSRSSAGKVSQFSGREYYTGKSGKTPEKAKSATKHIQQLLNRMSRKVEEKENGKNKNEIGIAFERAIHLPVFWNRLWKKHSQCLKWLGFQISEAQEMENQGESRYSYAYELIDSFKAIQKFHCWIVYLYFASYGNFTATNL